MMKSLPFLIVFTILLSCKNEDVSKKIVKESPIKDHPFQQSMQLTKKERKKKGLPPNKYFEQTYLLEADKATGRTYPENIELVKSRLKSQRTLASKVPGQDDEMAWKEIGPTNIGGRSRAMMFDPNDATNKRVFAGGVSGGLWVNEDITDKNSQWEQVGIDENLAVSSIVSDPNNSNVFYVGTGESYTFNDYSGNGLWKSEDGGNTWFVVQPVDLSLTRNNRFYVINDVLARDNNGQTEVYMAVGSKYDHNFIGLNTTGWYKSTDGGVTWEDFSFYPNDDDSNYPYEVSDIEIAKDNSIWVSTKVAYPYYTGGGTILHSIDGENFEVKYQFDGGERVEIATSKLNNNTVFALAEIYDNTTGGICVEVVKTTDGFDQDITSVAVPVDIDPGIDACDFTRGQAFYDLLIEVDPTDDNNLYLGGINLFRSKNGGASWDQISKWASYISSDAPLVHADQHSMVFRPGYQNEVLFSNDGGVYYSDNILEEDLATLQIDSRNKNLSITQFYFASMSPNTTDEFFVAGAQDNGTIAINGAEEKSEGFEISGGDGGYCFISNDRDADTPDHEGYVITSYIYNNFSKFDTDGSNYVDIEDDYYTGDFINAAAFDRNLEILYTNGSDKQSNKFEIARFSDLDRTQTRTNLSSNAIAGNITVLKVSPFSPVGTSTLFIGTENGKILKVDEANNSNYKINLVGSGFGDVSVSDISFGSSEDEIMITFHNYNTNNVWYTNDGGDVWKNKEGDLPDIPVKAVLMNPFHKNEVILGTGLGVWRTENFLDESPVWTQSFNGMSNVKVSNFQYRAEDHKVLASTYGRGIFLGEFKQSENAFPTESLKDNITLFPTIVENQVQLISKEEDLKVNIKIFSSNGLLVKSFDNIDLARGIPTDYLPIINLTTGMYFVHLYDVESGAQKSAHRIIVK